MDRILQLLNQDIMSSWHKFRYNWARELVGLTCSLVLASLFWYMIQDFLGEQVIQISLKMYHSFSSTLTTITYLMAGIAIGIQSRKSRSMDGTLWGFAIHMGESHTHIKIFIGLRLFLMSCFYISLATIISYYLFAPPEKEAIYNIFTLIFGAIFSFGAPKLKINRKRKFEVACNSLFKWRAYQILIRNPGTKVLLFISFICSLAQGVLGFLAPPTFLFGLTSLLVSLLAIFSLTIQLKQDIRYAWAERLMGVSHNRIVAAYVQLGGFLGTILTGVSILAYTIGTNLAGQNIDLSPLLTMILITLLLTIQAPAFFFQLDPKSPLQTCMAISIINLFQATAIIFHPLATIIIPIVAYYAAGYQHNRYYRS